MRKITYAQALNRVAEVTKNNKDELRKSRLQRRTEFTDLNGVPFVAQGDATHPAQFYISISPDLVYFLRFQFKLHIQPLISTVTGGGGSISSVDPTELDFNTETKVLSNSSTLEVSSDGVSPNPHSHTASGSGGGVQYGIKYIHTTSDNFTVKIHGIDITDYLIEQQDGDWIDGEGVYPTNKNEDDTDYYDVLQVATLMYNGSESDKDDAQKLLKPEFKLMEIESDAPFRVTMYLYCKYSVVGR